MRKLFYVVLFFLPIHVQAEIKVIRGDECIVGEPCSNANGTEWIRVCPEGSSYKAKKVKIKIISRGKPDEELPEQFTIANEPPACIYFSGVKNATEGDVLAYKIDRQMGIKPGEEIQVPSLKSKVKAFGKMVPSENPDAQGVSHLISNYFLKISTPMGTQEVRPMAGERIFPPQIYFLGDVNKDGLPDILIDFAGDQESAHYTFYLSNKKANKFLLEKVYEL